MIADVGDYIKFNTNFGTVEIRRVEKHHKINPEVVTMLVDADLIGGANYHVWEDDIIKIYTPNENPEVFL